jgi:hypothetical protein
VASSVESNQELDTLEVRHVCPERALAELAARGTTASRGQIGVSIN